MASLEQQDLKHDEVAQSLTDLVDSTSSSGDHSQETHIHTKADQTHRHAWIKRWIPEIEKVGLVRRIWRTGSWLKPSSFLSMAVPGGGISLRIENMSGTT